MPNHCNNILSVVGEGLAEFRERYEPDKGFCQSFLPMPEGLEGTTAPTREGDEEAAAERKALYGAVNWYDWACEHWGTKWGDYDPVMLADSPGYLSVRFLSAWGPPEKAVRGISLLFPKLLFTLDFDEPGCEFSGQVVYQAGREVSRKDVSGVGYRPYIVGC